jgi:Endonuclease I
MPTQPPLASAGTSAASPIPFNGHINEFRIATHLRGVGRRRQITPEPLFVDVFLGDRCTRDLQIHLRAADKSVNADRGDLDFDEGGQAHNECTTCQFDADSWDPGPSRRGDVARALLYIHLRYDGSDSGTRAENSHQPFRRREGAMARFRGIKTLQKFTSARASIHNHFNHDRHLNRRAIFKESRSAALAESRELPA